MLVLLSSSKRDRYREDILRCIAAPTGTEVQFRYSAAIVDPAICEQPGRFAGQEGVVCSVDLDVIAGPCPLVPVRKVHVREIRKHGKTVTVVFEVGDFAFTPKPLEVVEQFEQRMPNVLPRWINYNQPNADVSGQFFFSIDTAPSLQTARSVELWEEVVSQLYQQPGYQAEQFFWTVIGLNSDASWPLFPDKLPVWRHEVEFEVEYTLSIYVFHPLLDKANPKRSVLRLTSEPAIVSSGPHDTVVNSPYDLRRWQFQIPVEPARRSRRGWLQVGPIMDVGTSNESSPPWHVSLPLFIVYPKSRAVLELISVGTLVAGTGITSLLAQGKPLEANILPSFVILVLGFLAAYVSRYGFKKVT
jgi:hypothetical protein